MKAMDSRPSLVGGFGIVRDFGLSRWMLLHFRIWSRVVLTDGHISEKITAAVSLENVSSNHKQQVPPKRSYVSTKPCGGQCGTEIGLVLNTLVFPLSVLFFQCSILIFQHIHLSSTDVIWSRKPRASLSRTLLYLFSYFALLLGFFAEESRCRKLVENLSRKLE